MKKILIFLIIFFITVFCISEEKVISKDYKAWKNLYWSMYLSSIGYSVTYSSTIYIVNMASNFANNTLTNQSILLNTLFFGLQLCLIDGLNAIPTVGPYITSGLYLTFGILEMVLHSMQSNNVNNILNEGVSMEFTLRTGIAYLINFVILLPFGIIQTISKYKMKKLKNSKDNNLKINFNYNFLNKKDFELAISFNL